MCAYIGHAIVQNSLVPAFARIEESAAFIRTPRLYSRIPDLIPPAFGAGHFDRSFIFPIASLDLLDFGPLLAQEGREGYRLGAGGDAFGCGI
jgi:hypothetical protein